MTSAQNFLLALPTIVTMPPEILNLSKNQGKLSTVFYIFYFSRIVFSVFYFSEILVFTFLPLKKFFTLENNKKNFLFLREYYTKKRFHSSPLRSTILTYYSNLD